LVARIPATCQVLLKGAVLRSVGGCARGSRRVGLGVTAVARRRRSLNGVGDLRCHGGVQYPRLGEAACTVGEAQDRLGSESKYPAVGEKREASSTLWCQNGAMSII
jgi:hypothetical protein